MNISEFLKQSGQHLVTCMPTGTLNSVANLLYANNIGAMPVCESGFRMIGLISERDLVRAFTRTDWGELRYLRALDVMTTRVVTIEPQDSIRHAQYLMKRNNFRHLPIMKDGQVVGMLSLRDALASRVHETEDEINVLRDVALASHINVHLHSSDLL